MSSPPSNTLVEVTRSEMELEDHLEQWESLAENALDANIFYEPAPFLAAINTFAQGWPILCLFIYNNTSEKKQLIGFLPLLPTGKGPGNRIKCYRSFSHLHCYLATPLIHRDSAPQAIAAIFNWFNNASGNCQLMGFYNVQADGGFAKVLQQHLQHQPHMLEQTFQRAFLSNPKDPQQYFAANYTKHKRKEYRRLWRRLEEKGALKLDTHQSPEKVESWVGDFLLLESKGWKGHQGFAMGNAEAHTDFFRQMTHELAKKGRLICHSLSLDNQIIAMKCNLIAADGSNSFAFKIAFDEQFSAYSPGVLMELRNIEHLSSRTDICWMDSCADPNHPMIDKLWRERRKINYILYGKRSLRGRLLIWLFKSSRKIKSRH